MIVSALRLYNLNIPLKFQFSQSNNAGTRTSLSMVLEIHTEGGVTGYGEACPRTYVTGEHPQDLVTDFQTLAASIRNEALQSVEDLKTLLARWERSGIRPAARCAFESAWLDAFSKTAEKPMPDLLGGSLPEILTYSLVLPLVSPERLIRLLEQLRFFRPPAIKIKVDNRQADNLAKLRIIRDFFGEEQPVRLDVNGGWEMDEALEFIPQWLDNGVTSFEQPLAPTDYDGPARLTQRFGNEARIMADESVLDYSSAEAMIRKRSINHFNLKISKLGGIFAAEKIWELARNNGIPCQLGAHFGETSLLSSGGILLASLCPDLTAMEGALGEYLLESDICEPVVQHDREGNLGPADYFREPGLCRSIRQPKLEKYSAERWSF